MKVTIVGAGAVGGLIGTRLAAADVHVSAFARGETLRALRTFGWRLEQADGLRTAPVTAASDRAEDLGVQDLVVIAVKATALGGLVDKLTPLIGPDTVLMPAMNGVPWWFTQGLERALGSQPLDSVDPGGHIAAVLPLAQVVACVVYSSSATPAPGLVRLTSGNRLVLGEPQGGLSERVRMLRDLLALAQFDVETRDSIRTELWYKLWGNLTLNPLTAVTGATCDKVLADPLAAQFCARAMAEAQAIGARIGCAIGESPEDRNRVTATLGAFKPSMLQDAEAGRPLEVDAIVKAVHEIGLRLGVATPNIDALLGVVRVFAQVKGLYPVP